MPKCYSCPQPAEPHRTRCHSCLAKDNHQKLLSHTINNTEYKEYQRCYKQRLRTAAIKAYGAKCSCPGCNEDRQPFLTIDHIGGNGNKHRIELSGGKRPNVGGGAFYRWLRNNGYPPGYRVLCYNCNCARSTGRCPVHESTHYSLIEERRKHQALWISSLETTVPG